MGPELAAMDKVMYHSSDLYIHEFTLKNSLLLKNAIEDIENVTKNTFCKHIVSGGFKIFEYKVCTTNR